jgi:glycosyltransferase involved in cell wall biosynthesis
LKKDNISIKQKKISIITASFRSETTIRDTLESVNQQTYPQIEHIIIDGGSNDRTLDIVKAYGKRVAYIISEPDQGIFDAYNKGLIVATGDIIGILNSDDFYVTPYVIEHIMNVFQDQTIDAVYADLVYVDKKDTNKILRYWRSRPNRKGDISLAFPPAHPTLFLRNSVYKRTGQFNTNYKYAGDYEFMLRAFHTHAIKSAYINEIIIRMRAGGTTGGSLIFIKKQNQEILKALESNNFKIIKSIFFIRKILNRIMQYIRALLVSIPN